MKAKIIGICNFWLHKERYGTEEVELIGYSWHNTKVWDDKLKSFELNGEKEKMEYCQNCYDYHNPIMIENLFERNERTKGLFVPRRWFWFYEDDDKKQAIENGRQLDYYYQQKALYHKEIALLKEDIIIPSLIIAFKEDCQKYLDKEGKGTMIDLYIGDFGTRYCISCKVKKNDSSDKKLIMSLDNCKLCYDCGIKKSIGLIDGSNPQLIIKERVKKSDEKTNWYVWNVLDKQSFSKEIEQELNYNRLKI